MFTGYAFVVFKDVKTLNKVLAKSGHIIKGHKAFFAKAEAHGYAKTPAQRGGFRGGSRGRGSFRGGFRGHGDFRGRFRGRGRGGFHSGFGGPQVVHNYNYSWM